MPLVGFAESARNLVWISLLYSLSRQREEREHGAEARLWRGCGRHRPAADRRYAQLSQSPSDALAQTGLILRITTAAGALVLVHNVYGQAAPASRSHIRLAMLGLALIWIYDLNLYTIVYLGSAHARTRCSNGAGSRLR